MPETELVKKIGRHFGAEKVIPRTIRMRNIATFGKLFDLFQEFDNHQDEYKERSAKKFNILNLQKIKNKFPNKNPFNEEVQKPVVTEENLLKWTNFQKITIIIIMVIQSRKNIMGKITATKMKNSRYVH